VGSVLADRNQVHQVVLNLCANAREALGGRGRVEVELEQTGPPARPDAPATRWARLRVRDDGVGLDEATRSRLFEPYLTTRGDAGGHGLGLAVVHGIVTAGGGTISVESAPGRGATFDVSLPILDQAPALPPPAPRALGGRERLLLVDDEPLVRAAHRRVLTSLGYVVAVASDAEEALALLRAAPSGFDLVVTDMAMPGMSGFELARLWLREQPGARVLLCTGFSEDVDEASARAAGLKGLLLKPVSREDLDGAIRAALGR
jgi:CheY-like chemotaxis protein